jgi:hypothetical protein
MKENQFRCAYQSRQLGAKWHRNFRPDVPTVLTEKKVFCAEHEDDNRIPPKRLYIFNKLDEVRPQKIIFQNRSFFTFSSPRTTKNCTVFGVITGRQLLFKTFYI